MSTIDKTQCLWLQTLFLDENEEYAIFKKDGGTSRLIYEFTSSEEICGELLDIVVSHFPHMLSVLNIEVKYALHTNLENMPHFHYELYATIAGSFYLISVIGNIENISVEEDAMISKYPGAMDYIVKSLSYIAEKTQKAFI